MKSALLTREGLYAFPVHAGPLEVMSPRGLSQVWLAPEWMRYENRSWDAQAEAGVEDFTTRQVVHASGVHVLSLSAADEVWIRAWLDKHCPYQKVEIRSFDVAACSWMESMHRPLTLVQSSSKTSYLPKIGRVSESVDAPGLACSDGLASLLHDPASLLWVHKSRLPRFFWALLGIFVLGCLIWSRHHALPPVSTCLQALADIDHPNSALHQVLWDAERGAVLVGSISDFSDLEQWEKLRHAPCFQGIRITMLAEVPKALKACFHQALPTDAGKYFLMSTPGALEAWAKHCHEPKRAQDARA